MMDGKTPLDCLQIQICGNQVAPCFLPLLILTVCATKQSNDSNSLQHESLPICSLGSVLISPHPLNSKKYWFLHSSMMQENVDNGLLTPQLVKLHQSGEQLLMQDDTYHVRNFCSTTYFCNNSPRFFTACLLLARVMHISY